MTKKINLMKILMLFVCIAFILSGCRQELLKDDEEKFNPNVSKFQVVKLSDIPNVTKYIKRKTGRNDLKIFVKSKSNALAKTSIDFANLESSIILKKTENEVSYYVFNIINYGDEKTIYNFEVKEIDREIVSDKVLEYASDIPFGEDPYEVLRNFTGTVTAYSLDGKVIAETGFIGGENPCPPTNPPSSGNPPGGGTTLPPEGGYPNFPTYPSYPSFPSFPGSPGGGSSGGGSTTQPSEGCDNPDSYVLTSVVMDYGDGTGLGEYVNDCGWVMYKKVAYLSANANKSFSKITSPCDDGSGIIVLPYPIKNPTPCNRLKAITSNKIFMDNITALEGMTNDSSERGYRMDYANAASNNPTGINNQFLQNKPGTTQINFTFFLPATFAIIHTHYDSLHDPIFSPGDIIQFNAWLVAAKAWNDNPANNPKIDLKNLSYTLVTSWGNYTLTFDGTDVVPFSGYNIDNLNTEYINNVILPVMTVANVSGDVSFNIDKLEEGFLKFAKANLNMPGMKLFKLGSDGNTEIFLNNNNKRATNKCN